MKRAEMVREIEEKEVEKNEIEAQIGRHKIEEMEALEEIEE